MRPGVALRLADLDARCRPGDFRSVTTIVARLFHILEPDTALFEASNASDLVDLPNCQP